ncbi:hypothetical protein NC651_020806 [Populus alba x Populus x berolinensis]|nr:hypothetical protein NC651_020806 [Populus alba x Populus x berolinensis]
MSAKNDLHFVFCMMFLKTLLHLLVFRRWAYRYDGLDYSSVINVQVDLLRT